MGKKTDQYALRFMVMVFIGAVVCTAAMFILQAAALVKYIFY